MTNKEAVNNAKIKWGANGDAFTVIDKIGGPISFSFVADGTIGVNGIVDECHYEVGKYYGGDFDNKVFVAIGRGKTWEAAFMDAEVHELALKPKVRYEELPDTAFYEWCSSATNYVGDMIQIQERMMIPDVARGCCVRSYIGRKLVYYEDNHVVFDIR